VIGAREDGTQCAAVSGAGGDWLLEGDISDAWTIAARGGYSSPDSKGLARAALAAGRVCSPAGLDAMLADHVASGGSQGRDLERLGSEMLGRSIPSNGTEALRHRAAACRDLAPLLRAALDPDSSRLLEEVEYPLALILASMEHRGIELDMDSLAALETSLGRRAAELEEEAGGILGFPVNLRSPAQVSEILFKVLGLPVIRKTGRGGDSSGESVLQALSSAHPFVPVLSEHREVTKLLNTYAARLPDYVDRATGLVHTTFNQAVTATGRLSSVNPNLQNIPIRTERGREIRRCFRGRRGEMLVSADYSQVELRMLAHLAGEGRLREAFRRGSDIHASTAVAVFGSVTPENRRRAKEVNFSIIYGISAHGLAQRLAIGRAEAASVISRYLETYPEVGGFHDRCVSEVERTGCTRTVLGRRRRLGDLSGSSGQARKALERIAVNSTVQGSAADLVKLAMLRAHRALSESHPGAGLVLQVHDEIVASCPEGEEDGVGSVLSECMRSAMELEVPLEVETGKGRNWLDAHG
jgi:DNA polymerase-1